MGTWEPRAAAPRPGRPRPPSRHEALLAGRLSSCPPGSRALRRALRPLTGLVPLRPSGPGRCAGDTGVPPPSGRAALLGRQGQAGLQTPPPPGPARGGQPASPALPRAPPQALAPLGGPGRRPRAERRERGRPPSLPLPLPLPLVAGRPAGCGRRGRRAPPLGGPSRGPGLGHPALAAVHPLPWPRPSGSRRGVSGEPSPSLHGASLRVTHPTHPEPSNGPGTYCSVRFIILLWGHSFLH